MSYEKPTEAEFKSFFARDFPYGTDMDLTVIDADITRAQLEAVPQINEGLFDTQEVYTIANHYLSAHMLVLNIRASSQGLAGQYDWNVSSKSVGSVSLSSSIPNDIVNSPYYSWFSSSFYGVKYIMSIWPLLSGQVYSISGGSQA